MTAKAISYGAVELKQAAHRYWMTGFGLSVIIHLLAIFAYFLTGTVGFDRIPLRPGPIKPWGEGIQIDITTAIPKVPGVVPSSPSQRQRVVPSGALGTPEPVPDNPTTLQQTIMQQNEMGIIAEPGDGEIGAGGSIIPDAAEEVEPPIFRVVEKLPVPLHPVAPVYPEVALRAGLEGDVFVKMWVDRTGKVRKAEVVKSNNDIFNEAALDAALRCTFIPAYMNSGPVSVWVTVPYKFRIRG